MPVVLEDWISQSTNLRNICQKIRSATISDRTWYEWERLAGACYAQGKKICTRQYTQEQTKMLLCLAWLRRHHPRCKVTYRSLRDYFQANEYKLEEVFDKYCEQVNSGETFVANEVTQQPKKIALSEVKNCCNRIINREISRNCWASWKQYLGIAKYEKFIDEGKGTLLTYMACWRHDHPTQRFPSVNQLLVMMRNWSRRAMSIETASSALMLHQWQMQGCKGRDLHKYLAACGYKVSPRTLYKWGDFSKRRHYSVSELAKWKEKASKRLGVA
ncbi:MULTISPECIES: hypothetical protein [unclassified Tolypothrix]|uniref:hypothetical protein n=1 Tax=unclassified Tolypothrix TaxID=2649714 RepID=UPI0005EAB95F|nr:MULTISPECIES: hypothetical protein [unclassified Tolypothrix]EKF03388.1 hypothetical protein FDUTEX481_02662 [Tolypothrix sp. PCC 7601]MBE9081902.1 hypothetical protein [Tolypothrix sp. LEGE 11397]UYD27573.1 hypothetical protein HGR01_05735 [Tolypothrix sp. PCC 7712]UYD36567.1 hypothetical protein HG267_12975 [Tolypothrix sp. PCC 7601]